MAIRRWWRLQATMFPSRCTAGRIARRPPIFDPQPYRSADAPVRILDERGHLRTLEDIERDLIQLAIEIYSGHMTEVARRLGIGRSTLYRKVREQGLEGAITEAM